MQKLNPGQKQFIIRSTIFISLMLLAIFGTDLLAKLLETQKRFLINSFYINYIYLGIAIAFLAYAKDKIKNMQEYKQSKTQTALFGYFAILFYAIFFAAKYYIRLSALASHIYLASFISYGLGFIAVLFLALSIYNLTGFKVFFKEIMVSGGVTICFFCFAMILRQRWMLFASGVTKSSTYLLSLTNSDVNLITGAAPSITIDSFSATIGAPCSGIESIAMFTGLFTLLIMYDLKTIRLKRIPAFFAIGLTGMYTMSIIRIYLLFYVGKYNPELAMDMFHTNLGWILFVIYVLAYMYFAYPKIRSLPKIN